MANIKIAIINQSTVVTDEDARKVTAALQTQVTRDFSVVWGVPADLSFFRKTDPVPAGYWWLIILDNSDQAGALGYHDLTNEGLPLGKIFAKTDLQYGLQWSVTASHELLEILGDPDINLCAFRQRNNESGTLYAYEVCDACEDDGLGYKIGDVLVSDFVYPVWFEDFKHPSGTQFDYQGIIKEPFELLPGGYISIFNVNSGNGWTQLNAQADRLEYKMRAKVGMRRERRRIPKSQWLLSDPVPGEHAKATIHMQIRTTAEDCDLVVYINENGAPVLKIQNNGLGEVEGSAELTRGVSYDFEWHVMTTGNNAHAHIKAEVSPENMCFPKYDNDRDKNTLPPVGGVDDGAFSFTLN